MMDGRRMTFGRPVFGITRAVGKPVLGKRNSVETVLTTLIRRRRDALNLHAA